jgi:hypothetical protein
VSESVDEVMRRFEERQRESADKPRPAPPPPPPPARRGRGPLTEREKVILGGAVRVAEVTALDYPENSKESSAILILATFAREHLQ